MIQDMTDPITSALADVDTAITGMSTELTTLVSLAQQLQGEVGDGTNASAIASQIEQRATAINTAVQAAQSALSSSSGTAPSTGDASSTPTSDSTGAADTGASTDTSAAPTPDTSSAPQAQQPPTGSAMG